MTSETPEKTEAAAPDSAGGKGGWKCPLSDAHVHREDVRKVWKECQEESFWYRGGGAANNHVYPAALSCFFNYWFSDIIILALPLSLGSMAVTGGLIYNGFWKSSARYGPFPKLAVAGLLGFAVGKASYIETCRSKFQDLGIKEGPGFGPWSKTDHHGPRHRSCSHVCEECKKETSAIPAEQT